MKEQRCFRLVAIAALLLVLMPTGHAQVKKPVGPKSKPSPAKKSVAAKPGAAKSTKPVQARSAKPAATKAKPATAPAKVSLVAPAPAPPPVVPEAKPAPIPQYNNPFRKGTFSFSNRVNAAYSSFSTTEPNYDGNSSVFQIRAEANYFFTNHLAIGVDLRYSKSRYVSGDELNINSWATYLNVTYGTAITRRLNAYVRIGGGPGGSHLTDVDLGAVHTTAQDNKGKTIEMHGTLGLPVALEQNSSVFLTPYVNYQYYKNDATITITEKVLSFGIRLESYINPADTKGTKHMRHELPTKGASFFEANTLTSFGFTNHTEEQHIGATLPTIIKYRNGAFGLGYHYYFTNFLAGGLNIGLSSNTTIQGGGTTKTKGWSLQPMITLNPPVAGALHHLFFQIGYGWERINDNGTAVHSNYVPFRLGYDLFVAKNISFSPKIGYQLNVTDHIYPNATVENTESGFAGELAVRAWLDAGWFQVQNHNHAE